VAVRAQPQCQAAAGRNDAVAGHNDRIGIGAAGLADGTRRIFDVFGQLTASPRPAAGYRRDLLPDATLKTGAGWPQRQTEGERRIGTIGFQLAHRFGGQDAACFLRRAGFEKIDAGDFVGITLHPEAETGGCDDGLIMNGTHGSPLAEWAPGLSCAGSDLEMRKP